MTYAAHPRDSIPRAIADRAISATWAVPSLVGLDGPLIRWRTRDNHGKAATSAPLTGPRDLLLELAEAANKDDEGFVDLVRKYGPLRQNGLAPLTLTQRDPFDSDDPDRREESMWGELERDYGDDPTDEEIAAWDRFDREARSESVQFWRDFTNDLAVLLNGSQKDPVPHHSLRTFRRAGDGYFWNAPYGTFPTRHVTEPWCPFVPRSGDIGEFLTRVAEHLLSALPVRLVFDDGQFSFGPGNLASAIGLGVAHWVRRGVTLAVCDICGRLSDSSATPRRDRRFVCHRAECKRDANALRTRDARARKAKGQN